MKVLIFQLAERDTEATPATQKKRRRKIKKGEAKVYGVPAFYKKGSVTVPLVSDSLNYSDVTACRYSVLENSWRDVAAKQSDWRKYQTMLNRSRRAVGVHGAMWVEIGEEPAPDTAASPPVGQINSFTDSGYLGIVENDIDTQNEWDEGDISYPTTITPGDTVTGVMFRLARNNAVYFIPESHLEPYLIDFSGASPQEKKQKQQRAIKALFGQVDEMAPLTGGEKGLQSARMTGVKNALRSAGSASPGRSNIAEAPPTAPTGVINSFTVGGYLDLMEELRDFDEDVTNTDI